MVDSMKLQGDAEEAIGTVQDSMGGLLGDGASQLKGKAKQAAGQAKQVAGQAKEAYSNGLDTVRDMTGDQPVVALLLATLLGFVFGALLARR